MKKLLTFLGAVTLLCGITLSAHAETVSFDEFDSNLPEQNPMTPYYDDPITEEYAAQGIHFKSGPDTPAGLGFTLYGGDIFSATYSDSDGWATNWPGSNFPVLPPTSQYLGLDKPAGASPITGIVIEFDSFCTHLSFEYRRPGNNLTTFTSVNLIFFDTTLGWGPISQDNIEAYVDPSQHGIVDDDAWLPYFQDELPAFNVVLLYADKKFAIDNLSYYGQWDFDRDDDVDGKDLADFANASSATIEEDELASLAAKFGSTEFSERTGA